MGKTVNVTCSVFGNLLCPNITKRVEIEAMLVERLNFTLEQATKAQRGSRCTAVLFL
jgi:hypothetical protein